MVGYELHIKKIYGLNTNGLVLIESLVKSNLVIS